MSQALVLKEKPIIAARKRSSGKVMFLHLSVSHSVHRGGHAWQDGVCEGGMCGERGPCVAKVACMAKGACVVKGVCMVKGAYMVWGARRQGGMCGRRHGHGQCILVWQGFCQKLHENERNGTEREGCVSLAP